MRVITGSAKGYGLKASKHLKLRPTPARVKEAIFSSLAERIPGASVLELFAGTGAFSIETLSRGAASATIVENHRKTADLIQENLSKTHLAEKARLLKCDARQALEWLKRDGTTFDLIFADPPYLKEEFSRDSKGKNDDQDSRRFSTKKVQSFSWMSFLLESPILPDLLKTSGILMIEHFKKETAIESAHFTLTREFSFGDTVVGVFRKKET
jgi:16S rRNA G966 N2-methylase RsmD